MPGAHIVREIAVQQTPRVLQCQGLLDVPRAPVSRLEWTVSLPIEDRPWHVGLIVGPSGSGKTTIARELFGDRVITGFDWPSGQSVLDCFPPDLSIKDVIGLLTAVGFSTVPAWLRPFSVLSQGEQFRATVARALAESRELVVIDEFTSVVDRQVAQVASHTIQKTVRRNERQLIAVTCHQDVIDWLQPDWIYEPLGNLFSWRSLQRRPDVPLSVCTIDRGAWRVFSPYHYLTSSLHSAAHCFGGFVGDRCVAFTSYVHFPHPRAKNIMQGHRLVVLPDWQGLGIGGRLDDWLGQYLYERGYRYHNVITHPAMIAYYSQSPRWQSLGTRRLSSGGVRRNLSFQRHRARFTAQRISSTFVYVPPRVAV